MSEVALIAETVFDGAVPHRDAAVVIDGATIRAVIPAADIPAEMAVQRLPDGAWLAPGFIDLQVNGGGDVLFNDAPTRGGIAAIAAAHRRFGTTSLLPTLITDTREKMRAARAAAAAAMAAQPGVLGIHFEGPFLSPERAGIHDPALMRGPDADDLALLTAPFPGVTLVTLAPELVPAGFVAALAKAGVRVALGHSAASYDETHAALGEGLGGFTHLFNAVPPLASRAPGPIAAALETPGAWYGLIADGEHVAPAMLRLALRGRGRPLLITDAMPPVGGMRGDFMLQGRPIRQRDGRLTDAEGRLAGSLLDMASAVRNSVRLLGLTLAEALQMAAPAPAAALGLDDRLGHLRPGFRADLVALDPATVRVLGTWVAGQVGLYPA
ncbi:MAG TPA: N-acetylglucosamine-6-phosphate deacetylase [Stellaceae bacterium]|jgi:N-acetylglucosamine-6-phosphate deacetylase|nr:N-acetylglucosamine-6-phosphate deacetylase [Stellaceae bacterium]